MDKWIGIVGVACGAGAVAVGVYLGVWAQQYALRSIYAVAEEDETEDAEQPRTIGFAT